MFMAATCSAVGKNSFGLHHDYQGMIEGICHLHSLVTIARVRFLWKRRVKETSELMFYRACGFPRYLLSPETRSLSTCELVSIWVKTHRIELVKVLQTRRHITSL